MGQAVSKKIMPKISKATVSRDAQLAKDALDDIARKKTLARTSGAKYYDPSAQHGGFKRDSWEENEILPRDSEQQMFLKRRNTASPQEMPEDLIKFLNDAGPIDKQVDKEGTSPNIFEALKGEENEIRKQIDQSAKSRKRRPMPMVENLKLDENMNSGDGQQSGDIRKDKNLQEGLTTMKTTNFSTATREINDSELKLKDDELLQLLESLKNKEIGVEDYIMERYSSNNTTEEEDKSESKEKKLRKDPILQSQIKLLNNANKYIGIPVLMQDTDDTMVGAWQHRVDDLKLMKLTFPRNGAKLALRKDEVKK